MSERVPARNLRLIALIFLTIITPFIYAAPTSANNTEVPSSLSCTKQGNSTRSVCCRPSRWTDILTFYASNYFAHAATTRTRPGQSTFSTLCTVVIAFLFPMSGALRGVRAMTSKAIFADTDLQTAARAGALCMVVGVPRSNTKGRPVSGGLATKLHGRCKLPPGYVLMTVPRDATFIEDEVASDGSQGGIWKTTYSAVSKAVLGLVKPQQKTSMSIASSYNALKSLVAVLQALFAIATLYKSKGHQIDRFGYAAFGLTVVPYAVMSVINLCANLLCPEYPTMYLVGNQALHDLKHQYGPPGLEDTQDKPAGQAVTQQDIGIARQGELNGVQADQAQRAHDDQEDQAFEISGTIGTLSPESDGAIQLDLNRQIGYATHNDITDLTQLESDASDRSFILGFPSFLVIAAAVIAIIGGLSGFHKGSSTPAERVWTMMWLSFGLFYGVAMEPFVDMLENRAVVNLGPMLAHSSAWRNVLREGLLPIALAVPAIGGLVVVGKMINSYGVCSVV